MSIIGSISLTNKTGVFLGSVNIDNLNATPNQLLYTPDGAGIQGLTLAEGLTIDGTTLKTTGNADIQIVSNSVYVNDNLQSLSAKVAEATQADVIYVSSGSYGETLAITDKYNIAVACPVVGSTICEVLSGLNISGTSESIRVGSLSIKGSSSTIAGVGRYYFWKCVFSGASSGSPQTITIGTGSTKYMTFENCEFNQYCNVVVDATFASVVYFINCNFSGATLTLNNASPLQVIVNNCAGLLSYPTNATLIGLNVLTTGASQVNSYNVQTTLINGAVPISIGNQAVLRVPYETASLNVLDSNSNFTFSPGTNTLSIPNIQVTNVNGFPYTNITIDNQASGNIPFETGTLNSLDSSNNLNYNVGLNRLTLTDGEVFARNIQLDTAAVTDLTVTNINGEPYPPPSEGVSVLNQSLERIPFCTGTVDILDTDPSLTYDSGSQTMYVPNIQCTNVNGAAPGTSNVSVSAQAVNRLVTATAVTDALHANQDATWDGTQLELFNSSKIQVGRGNSGTSSTTNTGIGHNALQSITSGTGNTVIGANSESISSRNNNTVIGSGNCANMTAAGVFASNTVVGQGNDLASTGTTEAVCIGVGSKAVGQSVSIGTGINSATGLSSVMIGTQAGRAQTGGTNIVVGSFAGTSLTSGSSNVILGYFTEFTTNPFSAVVIGSNAAAGGGFGNIAIGASAKSNGKSTTNAGLAIGYTSQTGTTYNNCAVIGNNIPHTTVTADGQFWLGNSTNNLYSTTGVINPSDARDKVDIKDAELGLEFIDKLKPRMWKANPRSAYVKQVQDENGAITWEKIPNDGSKAGRRYHYGVVAQEMKQVMDEMGVDFVALKDTSVTGNGEGDLGVCYSEFFGVMLKAIQELSAKNKALEARVQALETA